MTVYCPQCDTANRNGSSFCNNCGSKLGESAAPRCPACGAASLPDAQFCQRCGAPVQQAPADSPTGPALPPEEEEPLEAELTSLTELLGPEAAAPAHPDQPASADGRDGASAMEPGAANPERSPLRPAPEDAATGLAQRLAAGLAFVPGTPQATPSLAGIQTAGECIGQAGAGLPLAKTFAAVLASRPAGPARSEPPAARSDAAARWVPRLLYLVLFLAASLPFLVAGDWSGSTIPLNQATAGFFQAVTSLRPGSPVLVAFDYDPAVRAELDPQAAAVLAHLMQRGARIVALSLLPPGEAIAQDALRKAAPGQSYRYGDDYLNLGYAPGEEAALAALGSSLSSAWPRDYVERAPAVGRPALLGVKSASDFALVIVLAGDERAVQRWLAQVQGRFGVRMVAGVSATAAPQMEPFVQSKQLLGLLTGLPGAAEYELLMNQPGNAVRMLDAQSLAHGAIVAFVLLGNVGYLVQRARRRGERKGA